MAAVVLECWHEARAQGAAGLDLRFNPSSWLRRGVSFEEQRAVLSEASAEAGRLGLRLRVYVTLKQDGPPASSAAALDFALAARADGVEGIDISRSYDVEDPGSRPGAGELRAMRSPCVRAVAGGLKVAVHCGWFDSPDDLRVAVDLLGARRLGHGLPAGRDPGLLRRLADAAVLVEVCPTAFIARTGEALSRHPLPAWLDAGVEVGVGTDHALAFATDIRREHELLEQAFPSHGAMLRRASR